MITFDHDLAAYQANKSTIDSYTAAKQAHQCKQEEIGCVEAVYDELVNARSSLDILHFNFIVSILTQL